jgi:hypothetical protein
MDLCDVFSEISVGQKAVEQSGDGKAMVPEKVEKARAHTDTHTYISYDMMEFMKCLSYGLS